MSDLVIAAVQMTSGEDVEANLERSRELVREAATAGALIVGPPENFAYLGGRAGPPRPADCGATGDLPPPGRPPRPKAGDRRAAAAGRHQRAARRRADP